MTVHFTCTTEISAPVERVFDASLSIDLHVGSMEKSSERAVAGITSGQIGLDQEVTWRARHFGIPWRMTSRITALDRPTRFVDQQVRGPFASFRHLHEFRERNGVTTMTDTIDFTAPAGPVGRFVETALLGRYLRHLINERNAYLVASVSAKDS